uniref:Uncharacterized protein n=1 Tax=Arundo donax TaxID=35708 RepID=A0A0A8Z9B2_ARUDO
MFEFLDPDAAQVSATHFLMPRLERLYVEL